MNELGAEIGFDWMTLAKGAASALSPTPAKPAAPTPAPAAPAPTPAPPPPPPKTSPLVIAGIVGGGVLVLGIVTTLLIKVLR